MEIKEAMVKFAEIQKAKERGFITVRDAEEAFMDLADEVSEEYRVKVLRKAWRTLLDIVK